MRTADRFGEYPVETSPGMQLPSTRPPPPHLQVCGQRGFAFLLCMLAGGVVSVLFLEQRAEPQGLQIQNSDVVDEAHVAAAVPPSHSATTSPSLSQTKLPSASSSPSTSAAPSHSPAPTALAPCKPFDRYSASLDGGHWDLCEPQHFTQDNCTREFHTAPGTCDLRRFDGDGVRSCLRGKHLVFVGDSLTRHQFEHLVLLVETGEQPKGFSMAQNPMPIMPFAMPPPCGTIMRCDQNRNSNTSELMENLYYHNAQFNITITNLGIYAFAHGHGPVGWQGNATAPFDMSHYQWRFTGLAGIARAIAQSFGTVDALQVNVGVWAAPHMTPDWEALKMYTQGPWQDAATELEPFEALVKKGKPYWATTTHFEGEFDGNLTDKVLGAGYVAARSRGWPIVDRGSLTRRLKHDVDKLGLPLLRNVNTDAIHYHTYASAEFNNLLLNVMCVTG